MNAPPALPDLRVKRIAHGNVAWLENGPSQSPLPDALPDELPALVLLHGIGSCASSWRFQLASLSAERRVLAWDAPGYGDSTALPQSQPDAADYAAAAADWLRAAGVQRPIIVGHSLGALMGAALAARPDVAARALVLVGPAQGYGAADPSLRAQRFKERVQGLTDLGAQRLAEERSTLLCAPGAPSTVLAQIRETMARVSMPGYAQAAWMLSNEQIDRHLAAADTPAAVLCGEADTITPPKGARSLAKRHGLPYQELAGVGHSCYVEDPIAFDSALRMVLRTLYTAESSGQG